MQRSYLLREHDTKSTSFMSKAKRHKLAIDKGNPWNQVTACH